MNLTGPQNKRVLIACLLEVMHAQHGFSQREVAESLRVSSQLLSDIKAGRRQVSPKLMYAATTEFDVDWDEFAAALPPEWDDAAAMVARHEQSPLLQGIDDPEERYVAALMQDIPRLDMAAFPQLRMQAFTSRSTPAVMLPILDRPTSGYPMDSESFTGQASALPAPAIALLKRSDQQPYLLRLLNGDHEGRFFAGDLLLVDQDISDMSSRVLAIRRHDDFGLVRWSVELEDEFHPIHINQRPPLKDCIKNGEVVGVVKAVVWSPVKQSHI